MWIRKFRVRLSPAQRTQKSKILTLPELYNKFSFHHHHLTPTHPHKHFSWLLRGLDMSDGPRISWYDSSRVRGGLDFQVDAKAEIKWDIREYFNESKIV